MAVNVATAPTAINDYSNRFAQYNAYSNPHSSYSSSSSNSPSSASPASPRSSTVYPNSRAPANPQQLRPLRAPTYIPAVLRPTAAPSRHRPSKSSSSHSISKVSANASPITPPSSLDSSWEAKEGQVSMEEALRKQMLVEEGITRIVTDEWNENMLETVTGAPTRDHWKPDSSSPRCDAPVCEATFSWRLRRHHCRRCGLVFCSQHSLREVPLDQHARFHRDGSVYRACDTCWSDFVAWERRHGQRGSGSSTSGSGSATPIPRMSRPGSVSGTSSRIGTSAGVKSKGSDVPVVGSVPRDWNWSTF